MMTFNLTESITLARIEPGDPGQLLQRVAVRAADRFLAMLPGDVRDALGLTLEAASALAKLSQGGGVDGWLSVLSKAQEKWVGVVNGQWEILPRCREVLRVEAAKRTPVDLLARVPLGDLPSCGGRPKKGEPLPGRIYWKPSGVGAVVENWSFDLAPTVGENGVRQSWVPDERTSRADGMVFCPALAPYSIPGEVPTTWGPGVAAIMARRYQEILRQPWEKVRWDTLDFLFHRLMSILAWSKFLPAGEIAWDKMVAVTQVQNLPALPDPARIYITPRGELWALADNLELWCSLEAKSRVMKITVGQAKEMLAALGGLFVKRALGQPKGAGAGAGGRGVGSEKGSQKGGNGGDGQTPFQVPSSGFSWLTAGAGAALVACSVALGVRSR